MTVSEKEKRRSQLVKLLVAKLIFDLFFLIGAVVVYAYLELPPMYRGWTDDADARHVAGWVADQNNKVRKVDVQLFVDGKFVAARTADQPRPDVREKFPAIDAACGFSFEMPALSPGEHVVNVYAIETAKPGSRPTVLQLGRSLSVKVE